MIFVVNMVFHGMGRPFAKITYPPERCGILSPPATLAIRSALQNLANLKGLKHHQNDRQRTPRRLPKSTSPSSPSHCLSTSLTLLGNASPQTKPNTATPAHTNLPSLHHLPRLAPQRPRGNRSPSRGQRFERSD